MKKILTTIILASFSAALYAAGFKTVEYSIAASNITSIEASQAIAVEYTQGKSTTVKVLVAEDMKDKTDVTVKNGKLIAKMRRNVILQRKNDIIKVIVTAPAVTDFEVSSAASIKINGDVSLPGKNIEIELSSASSFSAGSITCGKLEIECSSASSASIASCKTTILDVESSSTSSLTVNGIDATNVKGKASSTSSIKLSGKCINATLTKSSMGKIDTSNLNVKNLIQKDNY